VPAAGELVRRSALRPYLQGVTVERSYLTI
jgi:hypothetical protein